MNIKLGFVGLMLAFFSGLTIHGQNASEFINPDDHKVITTDRSDGRYLSTRGLVHYKMKNLKPELTFNEHFSQTEYMAWQTAVRVKLSQLMNFPLSVSQPSPKLLSQIKREKYTVQKWEIYPETGSVVPFLMLVPHEISPTNRGSAVICYPGSNRTKENLAGQPELNPHYAVERHSENNMMAKYYAEQGIVSIALDNPGIGEVSDLEAFGLGPNYDRNTLSRYLIDMGWHYLGLSAFNGQKIFDWLKTLDFIDPERIALSGHSLGTEAIMVLAVLNPDIKAVVFNDFLTNTVRRATSQTKPNERGLRPIANWLGHSVPGMWAWFDYADLLASLAPTPLLITEGGVTLDLNTVHKGYTIMQAEKNFDFRYYEKYSDPIDRKNYTNFPEGLDMDEFFEYANVDAPNHYFKANIAVPWLSNILLNGE